MASKFKSEQDYTWFKTLEANGRYPLIANRIFDTYIDASNFLNSVTVIPGIAISVISDPDETKNGMYVINGSLGPNESTPSLSLDKIAYESEISGHVTVTVSGNGNAVTSATSSGNTLTIIKGDLFSYSDHGHVAHDANNNDDYKLQNNNFPIISVNEVPDPEQEYISREVLYQNSLKINPHLSSITEGLSLNELGSGEGEINVEYLSDSEKEIIYEETGKYYSYYSDNYDRDYIPYKLLNIELYYDTPGGTFAGILTDGEVLSSNTSYEGRLVFNANFDVQAGNTFYFLYDFNNISTKSTGIASHAEGINTYALNAGAHAEGYMSTANGNYSHAEGINTQARAIGSHAEGMSLNGFSYYEGSITVKKLQDPIWVESTEKYYNYYTLNYIPKGAFNIKLYIDQAYNDYTYNIISETYQIFDVDLGKYILLFNVITEVDSGASPIDSGDYYFIIGDTYNGDYSFGARETVAHTEGIGCSAAGAASHAEGIETQTTNMGEHAEGRYNKSNLFVQDETFGTIHSIGIGTSNDNRLNAFEVIADGRVFVKELGGYDGTNPNSAMSLQKVIQDIEGGGGGGPSTDENVKQQQPVTSNQQNVYPVLTAHDANKTAGESTNYVYYQPTLNINPAKKSVAEGNGTTASGLYSHAEGNGTTASGNYSHTEGWGSKTTADGAHAEGIDTSALAAGAHAEGNKTIASEMRAHAEGFKTIASGNQSHAEGHQTIASGYCSHTEGEFTKATGMRTHAEGYGITSSLSVVATSLSGTSCSLTTAGPILNGDIHIGSIIRYDSKYAKVTNIDDLTLVLDRSLSSTILSSVSIYYGDSGIAYGDYSHIEGCENIATNNYEHAQGSYNISEVNTIHSIGIGTTSNGRMNAVQVQNNGNIYIYGIGGYFGTNSANSSTLQEYINAKTDKNVEQSYASFDDTYPVLTATEANKTSGTTVSSIYYQPTLKINPTKQSVAEGSYTIASASASHAEGSYTTASGTASHTEGIQTTASEIASHAEGFQTSANKYYSHAEGWNTTASGTASHAGGAGTIANLEAMTAIGKFNSTAATEIGSDYLFAVGNGSSTTSRSNAFAVLQNGIEAKELHLLDGYQNNIAYGGKISFGETEDDNVYIKASSGDILTIHTVGNTSINTVGSVSINSEESTVNIESPNGNINLNPGEDYVVSVSTQVNAVNGFFQSSDIRKKDIKGELDVNKCYEFIEKCTPMLYTWKNDDREQIGMIAQEVQEFFPEIVNTDNDGYLSLDYAKLTVIILRVLKDMIDKQKTGN